MQNHSSTMRFISPISSENLMQSRLGELGLQSIDVGQVIDKSGPGKIHEVILVRFICRYASYTDSKDSLNKSNNIHIPPNGRKISTSRIKSVRLPNQRLIYIWYSLQSWAVKKYLPLTPTHQRRRLYRRKLESNSSWSIKVSITKIASLVEVSSHIINYAFHLFNFFLLNYYYFSVFVSKNVCFFLLDTL